MLTVPESPSVALELAIDSDGKSAVEDSSLELLLLWQAQINKTDAKKVPMNNGF